MFIRLGDRGRPHQEDLERPGVGVLRNVVISNIAAKGADAIGCSITGPPGHLVERITLRDDHIEFAGGSAAEQARRVPEELPDKYPEYRMFDTLPAYGFYLRHTRGIRMDGVSLVTKTPDARPAIAQDDVEACTLTGIVENAADHSRGKREP